MTPQFDTYIRSRISADPDDFDNFGGCLEHEALTRSANVRIEYSDDFVTIHGLSLYPMPHKRESVKRLEVWIE